MTGYEKYFKKRREILAKQNRLKTLRLPHVWMGLIACVLACGSGLYLWAGDQQANDLLSKFEISLFGEAAAETAPEADTPEGEKTSQSGEKSEEKAAKEGVAEKAASSAESKSWSPEEVALFTKLEARKQKLDAKEAELNKLEEELQKQKEALEKRLAGLEEVRDKIATKLEDKVKTDQQKVDTLVAVYSNMKPVQAAKIVEGLNEDLAVEVLGKMKNKSAAEILNLMDAEKAKKISERFAGFREPASAGH